MQSDQDSSRLLIPSETLIPGPSLKGHELGDGHGHGHDAQRAEDPQQLGESLMTPSPQATRRLVEPLEPGLGKPGPLGEGIKPLSGLVAPHEQRLLQPPAPPAPIKAASPGASRATPGGDHVPFVLPLAQTPPTMIFSDLYKSPRTTLTKFRISFPHGGVPPPPDLDTDLVSRDKARNKEAVKRYLAEKIRNDWEFTWPSVAASTPAPAEPTTAPAQEESPQAAEVTAPPLADEEVPRDPGEEADSESDAESVYSTISEDADRFQPRTEWTSDLSDNDGPAHPVSPFRFDSPEAVGAVVRDCLETKRTRRRRAVREETTWNPGLACFEARRNAWTGAKTVRVKPKPPSPVSPSSTRRLFWRHNRTQSSASHVTSSSPPTPTSPIHITAAARTSTTTSESDSSPQRTASQDSTTAPRPAMYGSLYDKVVAQSLQPSCPVNLGDMLRACVVGWKRDGEWPPRATYPPPPPPPPPPPVHTTHAEVLALRQRKAQQQRSKNAENTGRRLSFVGFFNGGGGAVGGGGGGGNNKPAAAAAAAAADNKDKENGLGHSHSQSHSDEGAGSSGKALFRRSLQRVFSLGQHGGHASHGAAAAANGPLSPTGPPANQVSAAG
ncbi:hypothetical protein C8A00DRAFT_43275 [Chaetomidium leptoderma]|uniref:Gag1-like clamp domain-containing protein n=1 Tax=Chaetomidium leptoderma TaxID=669021 RepID=A0AAN6VMF5_9PEZI|nr:hypothetical protein C8A00DRAFT_43275 [Chaetomidium leptoderma]